MKANPYFPKLFASGQIGKAKIRNRTVMLPTGQQFESASGEITDKTIANFVDRAKGGFGLLVVACHEIGGTPERPFFPHLSLAHDKYINKLCDLTEAVHAHGAKMAIELNATGRVIIKGPQPVSSSAIPAVLFGEHIYPTPRPLEKGEIYQLMDSYAAAARRGWMAGFDIIHVTVGSGFLLNSFISPYLNKRTDEFGGSLENRMRLPLGIIKRIQEEIGHDFPIIIRMSADEFIDGGITTKESPIIARMFEKAGVAAIDVCAGIQETWFKHNDIMRLPEGWKSYIWEAIKKAVSIPVIANGNLRNPEFCEKLLSEGKADFAGLCRSAFADPEWPHKASQGLVEDICPCISCLECHHGAGGRVRYGHSAARCAVNANWGRDRDFVELKPASLQKRVIIIGGGPAGMEAARVAALRGHKVTLYEKQSELGGQLLVASKPPGKDKLLWFRDYLVTQLKKLKVKVELGMEVTPALVQSLKPDAVVIATGSEPNMPKIPGINSRKVVTYRDILTGKVEPEANKIIIVGGGIVGCETADFLAERKNKVTIVDILPVMAPDMEPTNRKGLMDALQKNNVDMLTERRLIEINDGGVSIIDDKTGNRQQISSDWVIMATGAKPLQALKDALEDTITELYVIGDSEEPQNIRKAVYEGSLIARKL